MMTDINNYLDFVLTMFFCFGLAFEVPVAVVLLVLMGIVPHREAQEESRLRADRYLHTRRAPHPARCDLAMLARDPDVPAVRGRHPDGAAPLARPECRNASQDRAMNELAEPSRPAAAAASRTLFGQPLGLATLFLTEMWERFTYYGIQAVLVLYMVAAATKGGLALDDKTSSSIYGLYVGSTYLLGLLGGWIADRLLGAQRAVVSGGILITAGNAAARARQHGRFLHRPPRHRHGGRAAEAQRQRDRRLPVPGRRRAARCRFLHFLHGHQHRRLPRLAPRADLCRRVRLAARVRAAGGLHGFRRRAVPVDALVSRHRRTSTDPRAARLLDPGGAVARRARGRRATRPQRAREARRGRARHRGLLGLRDPRRGVLRLSAVLRGTHQRRAPADARHGGAVHRLGGVLGRLLPAGRLVQPVRRALHRAPRASAGKCRPGCCRR